MNLKRIGVIHSPFHQPAGMPINVLDVRGAPGTVVVRKPSAAGLKDLEGFDRIWLFFRFDRARCACLIVTPYHDGHADTPSSSAPRIPRQLLATPPAGSFQRDSRLRDSPRQGDSKGPADAAAWKRGWDRLAKRVAQTQPPIRTEAASVPRRSKKP